MSPAAYTTGLRTAPVNRLTRNSTKNTTNRTLAIQAASAATTKKPNAPAISATIKKVKAQLNMVVLLSFARHGLVANFAPMACHDCLQTEQYRCQNSMPSAVAAEVF